MSDNPAVAGRKDRWIPACFILFFVCLAGLEIWFVTLANKSFTGVVTDDAYAIGLNYNDVMARREAERQLGWTASLAFAQGDGLHGALTLRIRDRDGQPLVADNVRATAERMSRSPQIQAVDFKRQSDGEYKAHLVVPLAGRWFVRARIEGNGQAIQVIQEVDVRP